MPRKTIKILLPTFPPNCKNILYLKGYVRVSELSIIIYLIEFSQQKDMVWGQDEDINNVIHGFCAGPNAQIEKPSVFSNYIVFNYLYTGFLEIKKIILFGKQYDPTVNCIVMLFQYDSFKETGIIFNTDEPIKELQSLIQRPSKSKCDFRDKIHEPILKTPFWLSYTMFGQHVVNYINLIYWLFITITKERKISIRQGNLILAAVMDILLGYIVLQLFTLDKKVISKMLMGDVEKLVDSLNSLLKWLMGAPAGLKLNNAFNNMLGKYFTYHINLWSLFLDVIGEKLDIILCLFHYIGYAGFTFQAAIISDMICIATFHSYCIYVYAARLFNIQVSGLIALLRLFVGRKYNPLRGGIDSCEYTNQELFVGTVAFTILLLLMPTTAMYYAVFTLFRILSLVVQHFLAKLIYLMQIQPSYVIFLWLKNSSKVAGNILVEVVSNEKNSPLILKINLLCKSLRDLVQNFKPPVELHKHIEFKNLLSNVLTGKQIL